MQTVSNPYKNYDLKLLTSEKSGKNVRSSYFYGFQGQEKDDEIKDVPGSSINYKYRMHDPRLGRFFSSDPLATSYPYNSPYAFQENKLGLGTELEGMELEYFEWLGKDPVTLSLKLASVTAEAVGADWMASFYATLEANFSGEVIPEAIMGLGAFYYNNPGALLTDIALLPGGNQLAKQITTDLGTGLANGDPEAYANTLLLVSNIVIPKIAATNYKSNNFKLRGPAKELANPDEGILITTGKQTRAQGAGKFENIKKSVSGVDNKYLWTFDENGLNIGLEETTVGSNKVIKHTNLSSKAYGGGEVWFTGESTVNINAWSGRYGAGGGMTQEIYNASIEVWKSLGYEVNVVPLP